VVDRSRRRADAKQETREALIEAALAEFAEHGLDAPSLDAICARAGYTRGAFYVHFRDRAELLVAVVEHAMTLFIDAVLARGGEGHDLERTIDRYASAVAGTMTGASPAGRPTLPLPAGVSFARVLEAVTREPRLRAGFTTILAGATSRLAAITSAGQSADAIRADVDAPEVATVLLLVALGVMVALDVGMPLAPAALRDTVLRLVQSAPAARACRRQ
jgi:AcrR family transcriptional regulator